jgi:hypothetical protein
MEIDKYYGFYFSGKSFNDRKLCQTYLPVDQLYLMDLLAQVEGYSHGLEFKANYGFVKELTLFNGDIKVNSPSKVGEEELQAFVIKRKGDVVTNKGKEFIINGEKIDFDFLKYNVNVVEVND